VSAAAEQVSRSVATVSAGSEQMGASIREISQNATEAARVAGEAVDLTASTSATMNKLGESSTEIGNVIKVITAIAEQTANVPSTARTRPTKLDLNAYSATSPPLPIDHHYSVRAFNPGKPFSRTPCRPGRR
jgi:ABC-type transporter Mla subunit MlaD